MKGNFSGISLSVIVPILLLLGLGGAILASVTPSLSSSQIFFYVIGIGLFWIFSRIDYRVYLNLEKQIYLISIILLVITLIIGFESRGSIRWVSIGPLRLQFSELLKPFLITAFAAFLSRQQLILKTFLKAIIWAIIPFILVFKQPDLGSSIVYLISFGGIIFATGVPLFFLFSAIGGAAALIPILWHFLADYQKQRLSSFILPNLDPQGANYNSIQALITIGSGMFFGKGFGLGTQSHLRFLPERHTDFVFASVAEEFGFIGAALLLFIYFFLLWRIFSIAINCHDRFASLTALGIGFLILTQVVINVGMNLGLLPVTGITLPLVSYGGSSVLSTMIGLGIVQNIISSHSQAQNP